MRCTATRVCGSGRLPLPQALHGLCPRVPHAAPPCGPPPAAVGACAPGASSLMQAARISGWRPPLPCPPQPRRLAGTRAKRSGSAGPTAVADPGFVENIEERELHVEASESYLAVRGSLRALRCAAAACTVHRAPRTGHGSRPGYITPPPACRMRAIPGSQPRAPPQWRPTSAPPMPPPPRAQYAMSVIVGRALPDVRDGLKPVHRRILWVAWATKGGGLGCSTAQ